jgi:hypothetical protein
MLKSMVRVALASAFAAACGWLIWSCAEPRLQAVATVARPASPAARWTLEDLVASAVAVIAVCAYAVFMTTALVAIGSSLVAPRQAASIAARGWAGPVWWRRAVLAVCGIGVVMQVASAEAMVPDSPACAAACAPSLDGLPYPDLPTAPWPHRAKPAAKLAEPPRDRTRNSVLVVRAGDSLWSIATDLSHPDASDATVAAVVARLYAANLSVIGDHPDLIYPGTLLQPPGGPS